MLDTRPEGCIEAGLNCRICIESFAANLSQICTGLRGKALRQIFFQVYSDPACAPVFGAFERLYEAEDDPCLPLPLAPARQPVRRITAGAAA